MTRPEELIHISPSGNLDIHRGVTSDSDLFPLQPLDVLAILRLKSQTLSSTHALVVDVLRPTEKTEFENLGQAFIALNEQRIPVIEELLKKAEHFMDEKNYPGPKALINFASELEILLHDSTITGPHTLLSFPT